MRVATCLPPAPCSTRCSPAGRRSRGASVPEIVARHRLRAPAGARRVSGDRGDRPRDPQRDGQASARPVSVGGGDGRRPAGGGAADRQRRGRAGRASDDAADRPAVPRAAVRPGDRLPRFQPGGCADHLAVGARFARRPIEPDGGSVRGREPDLRGDRRAGRRGRRADRDAAAGGRPAARDDAAGRGPRRHGAVVADDAGAARRHVPAAGCADQPDRRVACRSVERARRAGAEARRAGQREGLRVLPAGQPDRLRGAELDRSPGISIARRSRRIPPTRPRGRGWRGSTG